MMSKCGNFKVMKKLNHLFQFQQQVDFQVHYRSDSELYGETVCTECNCFHLQIFAVMASSVSVH